MEKISKNSCSTEEKKHSSFSEINKCFDAFFTEGGTFEKVSDWKKRRLCRKEIIMPTFHSYISRSLVFKRFCICGNWFWCPDHGHYGYIWIYKK